MSEACKLDAEAVIAVVKLVGYEKKECQGTPHHHQQCDVNYFEIRRDR